MMWMGTVDNVVKWIQYIILICVRGVSSFIVVSLLMFIALRSTSVCAHRHGPISMLLSSFVHSPSLFPIAHTHSSVSLKHIWQMCVYVPVYDMLNKRSVVILNVSVVFSCQNSCVGVNSHIQLQRIIPYLFIWMFVCVSPSVLFIHTQVHTYWDRTTLFYFPWNDARAAEAEDYESGNERMVKFKTLTRRRQSSRWSQQLMTRSTWELIQLSTRQNQNKSKSNSIRKTFARTHTRNNIKVVWTNRLVSMQNSISGIARRTHRFSWIFRKKRAKREWKTFST